MYEMSYEEEIIRYLPLVRRVVNRITIKNKEYEQDDLFNIGVIGLMDALKKFDASKQVPFESYARIRIKGAIIDEVRKTSKVSRSRMDQLNLYYQAKEKLESEYQKEATDQQICREMGISAKQLSVIYDTLHHLANISLEDTLFNNQGDATELKDMIQDESLVSADDKLFLAEAKESLSHAISTLKERDQLILNLYYVEELTLKEIAEVLEISVPRVSQLHGKIISQLKQLMEDE
ncbi:FliA/WhiG family RNA polymerase sigma factor [Vagococcus penaei]|uniref:RNA polymerase n=1 Tax=Vagococcus penaei TaxID=633807 RepID=A0A1Q2D887_9ENTE|nr:FliA/WhiG family RNA polymerase sigma factor [Vagococcus penaei]AQP54577.1 RNA polymerase [Vagococcus penaei]RSU06711.1 FliA/WhiG family RNA polymerase sigma factor [Vagococcus penaei]